MSAVWGDNPGRPLLDAPVGRAARIVSWFGHGTALLLLAEAAASEAQDERDRATGFGDQLGHFHAERADALWGDAVVYLGCAGVLTPEEAFVAVQLLEGGWAGSLEELVVAAKAVNA